MPRRKLGRPAIMRLKIRSRWFGQPARTCRAKTTTGLSLKGFLWIPKACASIGLMLARLFLTSHNSEGLSNIIGSVIPGSARIENGKGIARIQLSSAGGDVDTVQKIREGVIRNISVGYWVFSSTRSDDEPPVVTATDWQPIEISAVAIPADADARIRSAGRKRPRNRQTPQQRGAAEATRLLNQTSQSSAQARGAAEARKALAGPLSGQRAKSVAFDKRDVEKGAREARKLLRRS